MNYYFKIGLALTYGMFAIDKMVAQSLFNVNSTLALSENAVLSVSQDLVNEGKIINNGRMVVGQDWKNNGEYAAESEGNIVLNGTNEQYINHNAQTFNRVIISGGNKIFEADLTVTDNIEFSEGKLFSENDAKLIIGNGASITGGSVTSYVVGSLYITSGTERFYPVGTEDLYLPVTLGNLTGNSGAIGIQAQKGGLVDTRQLTVSEITNNFHWNIDAEEPSESKAIITLGFQRADFLANPGNAVVVEAASPTAALRNLGGVGHTGSLSLGTVTSNKPGIGPLFTVARRFGEGERPPISILNLLTPNGDFYNEFIEIRNIEYYPNSTVTIFNRLGNKVFEIAGYDNDTKKFVGVSNNGKAVELASGTYYMVVKSGGDKLKSTFIEIIR